MKTYNNKNNNNNNDKDKASIDNDDYAEFWMKKALYYAKKALSYDEVPIGAVIVKNNSMVSFGYNKKESSNKATAHAEIIAIERACKKLGSWRLVGCDLFVTVEPCIMCAGAIIQSRIDNLYFGTVDPKGGAIVSNFYVQDSLVLNHKFNVYYDILKEESRQIISSFFKEKRRNKDHIKNT